MSPSSPARRPAPCPLAPLTDAWYPLGPCSCPHSPRECYDSAHRGELHLRKKVFRAAIQLGQAPGDSCQFLPGCTGRAVHPPRTQGVSGVSLFFFFFFVKTHSLFWLLDQMQFKSVFSIAH